jgi:tripartite-type tricarboxylate transporter receptor subunit TctC
MPPQIVARLNAVMNAFLQSDPARKRFEELGFQPRSGSPEQLTKKMIEDTVLWTKVIKDANVTMTDPQ